MCTCSGPAASYARPFGCIFVFALSACLTYRFRFGVTLCRWSAKQTIPLSVLARNQTKGLYSRSRRDRKYVRERERNWTKGLREGVGEGWREWPVDSGHRKDQSDEIGSSRSEGRRVKMSQQTSWVVEFSLCPFPTTITITLRAPLQCPCFIVCKACRSHVVNTHKYHSAGAY